MLNSNNLFIVKFMFFFLLCIWEDLDVFFLLIKEWIWSKIMSFIYIFFYKLVGLGSLKKVFYCKVGRSIIYFVDGNRDGKLNSGTGEVIM